MVRLLPLALLLAACADGGPDTGDTDSDTPATALPWPSWAFEPWVWEDESTQESALALVDGYQSRGIPTSAIILDSPWETAYNTFVWDEGLYPDPAAMVDELHSKGVRVVLWITPMINTDAPNYQEAADAGYFLKVSADATEPAVIHWWKGDGSLIDFFSPEAVAWWHDQLQPVLDLGIDGWKCDGADYYAGLAPYSPGAGEDVARLDYSHAYYQDFYDHTREVLGDDRLIMSRPIDAYGLGLSGDLGAFSPKGVMFAGWVGDQDPTFDGMRVALENFWQSAAYGYFAFGSDIGGYREDDSELGRTEEVFLRWAGLGAFSPVMENGGGGAHEPWRFSEQATAAYKGFADLHHALVPYLMASGARSWAEQASLFHFLDPAGHEDLDSYAFRYRIGDDLFVQPVLAPGTSVTVTFPDEGRWTWLYGDHATYDAGTTVTLDVPLDAFPAFAREGTTLAQSLLPAN